jgi:hypothetical protein
VAVLAAGVVACGDDAAPREPVRLDLEAPGDLAVVRESTVEVSGRVSPPDARVRVRGRQVDVSGGSFRTSVGLEPGTNVIDVLAGAGDSRPAMAAVRVRRQVTVEVPDLGGYAPADAADRLEGLGLRADIELADDILESLLPGEPGVCRTEPAAGAEVDSGSSVTVFAAKRC